MEYIVYTLADAWNVPVDEPLMVIFQKLEDNVTGLKTLILRYSDAAVDDRSDVRRRILKQASELQRYVLEDVVGELETASEIAENDKRVMPRMYGVIIRDIGRTYSRDEQIRKDVKRIEQIASELYSIRNDAAHADAWGQSREVSHERVEYMLEKLQEMMVKFSGIGNALRHSEFGEDRLRRD